MIQRFVLLVVVFFSINYSAQAQVVAEYRFDETEYNDIPNEIIDTIGGFNGQAKSSQPTEDGKVCNAIDLSASGIYDYAILDEHILSGKTNFTVSLWSKTAKTTNQSLLSGAGAHNNEMIMWYSDHDSFRPFLRGTSNGTISTASIADSAWHHLVWTRQGSQSCLYQDKILQGCVTQATQALSIQSLILGQEQDSIGGSFSSSQAFEGSIDELLIFDHAISAGEIADIYDNQNVGLGFDGSARTCPPPLPLTPPVLDMRFDELNWSAANSVLDTSGNDFHATATNVTPTSGFICNAADMTASGTSDYITLDSRSLDARNKFSISLWYKTPKTTTQSLISGANPSSFNELIMWFTSDTRFRPYLHGSSRSINTTTIADNAWHHLVWTRSGSINTFYRDGVLQTGNAALSAETLDITSLILGQEQDSIGGHFDSSQAVEGLIDELLIFERPLSASEINSIFTNQTNGFNYDGSVRECSTQLLLNMRFDESAWSGVAGEVIDETGNFNAQSKNGATTAQSLPAIEGNPGTCGFGVFDGINDYIVVLDDPRLDISTELTITSWIKPESIPSSGLKTIVSKDENYEFHLDSSGEIFWWWQTHSFATTGAGITPGNWYHIAITYKSGQQFIYVNGVEKGSRNYTGNLPLNNDPLQIGQDLNFTSRSFHGFIDEVRIYTNALNKTAINTIYQETHPCAISIIDHFEINHDGQGLTCEAESITIKACADASCSALSSDATDVQLSINGSFYTTISVAGGSTTTNFSNTSVGTATLSLDQTYECKNGGSASCDVDFSEAGFVLDINGANDVESCDATKSLLIKAVKLSDNGVSCAPAFTGSQSLDFVFNYQSPITGTKVPVLATTTMAASGVTQNRSITFDGNGEATLAIQYDDAGELNFSVSEVVSSGVTSATLNKAFYPAALVVSTALTSTDSEGLVTQKAGIDFPINVIAQCQGGTTTPNYSPQTNTSLQLSVQQKEPTANTGTLTIGGASINATNLATTSWGAANQATVNFDGKYSEVGIVNLAAQDVNYFGNQINSAGYSTVGRFIPDHFEVAITNNSFADACTAGATDFTYIGQPFSYLNPPELLITAKNASEATTQNYTEAGYQKLTAADITRTFSAEDSTKNGTDNLTKMVVSTAINVGDITTPVSVPNASAGEMTYTFNSLDSFAYAKDANALVDSFPMVYDITIDSIQDSDGVNASTSLAASPSSNLVSPTGVNLRFGRWIIENTFGPETSDLPIPMTIQYYDENNFSTNILDSCTSYNKDDLSLSNITLAPNGSNGLPAIGLFGDGKTNALYLNATGVGNQGEVGVTYTVPAWLQYDWSWNGTAPLNFTENPSAVATFGLFRGNDRIIYQREVNN